MKLYHLFLVIAVSGCMSGINDEHPEANATLQDLRITLDNSTGMSVVKAYVFEGKGDSMRPALEDGKFYLCLEQNGYAAGDIVAYNGSLNFIRNPTKEQTAKGYVLAAHRIISISNGFYRIKGDNNRPVDTVSKADIFCRILFRLE
ncbi:MAG: S24/S26 family peptidase [Candidatus Aenigmarchaeota archaeon]|nr:S24/S26 family peptidase [Candidatus Aenigmarchaeota archaeon]